MSNKMVDSEEKESKIGGPSIKVEGYFCTETFFIKLAFCELETEGEQCFAAFTAVGSLRWMVNLQLPQPNSVGGLLV